MATSRKYRSVNTSDSVFASQEEVKAYPKTGLVYQDIKLFIEGVEVPFFAISINQAYGSLPTASIQIPYFAGLNEICRNYAPKVHIFYKDYVYEKYLIAKGQTDYSEKDLLRTLFEGVAFSSTYGRQKSASGGSAQISFGCVHKYSYLGQIILKFGGRGAEDAFKSESETTAVCNYMNSQQAIIVAMGGVENTTKNAVTEGLKKIQDGDTQVAPGSGPVNTVTNVRALQEDMLPYYSRLQGTPGVATVLWNSLKRDSYIFKDYAKTMTDLYIPLVDGGMRFFKRMTGHPSIEVAIKQEKIKLTDSDVLRRMSGTDSVSEDASIMVPPVYRNFLNEAVATELGLAMMKMSQQITGERTSLWEMMNSVYGHMQYDMQVLASPVQVADSTKDNIDVLVKPVLPYYFAPTCNVLLPHMYTSIQISDSSNASPTRMTAQQGAVDESLPLEYRSPHEVRQVAAVNSKQDVNLAGTFLFYGEYPTPTEMGRGVLTKKVELEPWVQHLFNAYKVQGDQSSANYVEAATGSGMRALGEIVVSLNALEPDEFVWKYWYTKDHPIPIYYGSRSKAGKNIRYGSTGPASGPAATAIQTFRNSTGVPGFWNVVYFPFSNSCFAYPPHYDYVNRAFYITADIPPLEAARYNKPDQSYDRKEEKRAADSFKLTSPAVKPYDPLQSGFWEDKELERLRKLWADQHPNQEVLNPFAPTDINGAQPYQDMMINTMDYKYALALTETRQGSVDAMFNPHIVPGYPMEIIDPSPERPSFHAFCVSVTHNITPRDMSTSISFSNVLSYDELRNYELPSLLPWFQKQLGFGERLSLVHQTDQAKELANNYYMEVLGCGFADPTILENEQTNSANFVTVTGKGPLAVTRTNVNMSEENSRQGMLIGLLDQNMSYEGNLALTRREIETMSDIEALSGITFVSIPYGDQVSMSQTESLKVSSLRKDVLEKPGRSLFLDYTRLDEALRKQTESKLSNAILRKK